VVLGAVSNIPHQIDAANEVLEGKTLDASLADQAAARILEKAEAHSGNGYKIPMAKALVRRTLMRLIA
jgi:CO/xanthine dehydrogenase FAD-binding subunit